MTARYAIYFSPAADSDWGRFGAAWLGRCAYGAEVPPLRCPVEDGQRLREITAAPRRYGFHATLKAPFRLAAGARCEDLFAEAERLCAGLASFRLSALQVTMLDGFLALVPGDAETRLSILAERCVRHFDRYRAPMTHAERARRSTQPLSDREAELLDRWGYPHVLDHFRFHFTLTNGLGADHATAAWATRAAAGEIAARSPGGLLVDALTVFEEPSEGADFKALRRIPFGHKGRLVYLVGPSGAGKDSVLAWARERLKDAPGVRFARRTITRPPSAGGEEHLGVSEEEFRALQSQGSFAMTWRANGCWYGISHRVRDWLASGLTVVVNGSRSHLDRVKAEFPQVEVVHVVAPPAVIHERLIRRGREGGSEIAGRFARNATWVPPSDVPSTRIANDSDLAAAGDQLRRYLVD